MRHNCSPRITESAARLLANEYVELRGEAKRAAGGESGDMPAIPITVRQLEAVIRISESLAKMALQTIATEAHVRQALELFRASTMDAVRSGMMDMVVFTDEQKTEIHRVEEQIKRRVAIGSFVSERKLVDELVRWVRAGGQAESWVQAGEQRRWVQGGCNRRGPLWAPQWQERGWQRWILSRWDDAQAQCVACLSTLLACTCRVGFNENLVRKGLLFLQTTGDFEYRRERRLVHRLK